MTKKLELKLFIGLILSCLSLYFFSGIHGFSTGYWSYLLEDKKPDNILFGETRSIRSDDWGAQIPILLSQSQVTPKFSKFNNLIGYEPTNTSVSVAAPSYDWLSFFRPTVWGFFLGNQDQGLAWNWIMRSLILFSGAYYFARIFINPFYSFFVSLSFLYARFFQYWSLNMEPMTGATLFCGGFFYYLCRAQKLAPLLGYSIGFLYSALVIVFGDLYPAWQIIAVLFLIFFGTGVFVSQYQEIKLNFLKSKIGVVFSTALIAIMLTTIFFVQNKEAFNIVTSSVYPGKRISMAGSASTLPIISQIFSYKDNYVEQFYSNICESAGFTSFAIIFFLILLKLKKLTINSIGFYIFLYGMLISAWMFLPLPMWFGKSTGLFLSPTNRSYYGLGLMEFVAMILFIQQIPNIFNLNNIFFLKKIIYIFLGLLALVTFYLYFSKHINAISLMKGAIVTIPLLLLIKKWNNKFCFVSFHFILILSTIGFNPINRNTYKYLSENSVAKAITEKTNLFLIENNRQPKWSFINQDYAGNIFRILGLNSLDGLHPYPQFTLWNMIDPNHIFIDHFNRFARVSLWICEESCQNKDINIMGSGDIVQVKIALNSVYFDKLGLDFLLISKTEFENHKNDKTIWKIDDSVNLDKYYLLVRQPL